MSELRNRVINQYVDHYRSYYFMFYVHSYGTYTVNLNRYCSLIVRVTLHHANEFRNDDFRISKRGEITFVHSILDIVKFIVNIC